MRLRRAVARTCLVLGCFAVLATPVRAATPAPLPPSVQRVTPTVYVANGKPLHVTVLGTNLGGATGVAVTPQITNVSFSVFSDTTVLVTLPADIKPGQYYVRVDVGDAGSDPAAAEVVIEAGVPKPAVVVTDTGTDGSLTTTTGDQASSASTAAGGSTSAGGTDSGSSSASASDSSASAAVSATSASATTGRASSGGTATVVPIGQVSSAASLYSNPLFNLALGALAGGLLFALWGQPGRLDQAIRGGFFMHLVARPAQRLRLGRICLQCGKLHWRASTPSELWEGKRYCSTACSVAAEADLIGDRLAGSRLREVVIYSDLETQLELVFRGEAALMRSADALFGGESRSRGQAAASSTALPRADHPPGTEQPAVVAGPVTVDPDAEDRADQDGADAAEIAGSPTAAGPEHTEPKEGGLAVPPVRRRRHWWTIRRRRRSSAVVGEAQVPDTAPPTDCATEAHDQPEPEQPATEALSMQADEPFVTVGPDPAPAQRET